MDLFIVITLAVLAVVGIVVGVSNDAVNFLNSAFGSKVAKKNIILTVAGVGVMVGVMTSSGMMDVARSGVFYPAMFSYEEIMILFLGMMLLRNYQLTCYENSFWTMLNEMRRLENTSQFGICTDYRKDF